jgi:hypothetical protein
VSIEQHVEFYREHNLAWLFRALNGMPERSTDIVIGDDGQIMLALDMPESRARAIRSWMRITREGLKDDRIMGLVLVLRHLPTGRFILTQKDMGHPKPDVRLRLALMGGCCAEGEDPVDGMLRELYEEVHQVEVGDMIAARMGLTGPAGSLELPGVQWPTPCNCSYFIADAAFAGEFDRWYDSFTDSATGLTEANPIMSTAEELYELIKEERRQPGRHFIASHHLVLEPYVRNCLNGVTGKR